MLPKFIMLIGLPGSGKSTYAAKLTNTQKVTKYLSSDKIREELYGDESIQGDPNKIFRIMHERVKEYLAEGYDVVYDATNVTRKNRRGIVTEVKKYCDDIEAHIVWAPYTECITRDKTRKKSVGEDVIRKFLYRWQSPNYDEGFTNIELIFNCNVGWNRIRYNDAMITNMNIPHDNPHHTLSIADHSAAAESYIYNSLPNSIGLDGVILCEAAAFHDIGKPFTKGYKSDKETGKIDYSIAHYYNHDNVGGYFVYGCYDDIPVIRKRAIEVSWLVCNHMQPYFQSNYYKKLTGKYKDLLDKLHEADLAAH